MGLFFGIFVIDLSYSAEKAAAIKEFGDSHDMVIQYELLKEELAKRRKEQHEKFKFFNQAAQDGSIRKALEETAEKVKETKKHYRKNSRKNNGKAN